MHSNRSACPPSPPPQAHHEFSKYLLLGSHVDTYSRGAAAKAYDHLLSLGLVAFVDPRCAAGGA